MNLGRPVRPEQSRDKQVGARRGVPGAAEASPAGGLVVGNQDRSVVGTTSPGHQV